MLGLITKSGLRPYSRYKASLYTGDAATYWAINRTAKHKYSLGYKLLGKRGRVIRQRKGKCESEQGFKGGKRCEGCSLRVLVNGGMKHRGNEGKTKGVVWKK